MYSALEELVKWVASLGFVASTSPEKDAPDDPDEFVTVERESGGVTDHVDHPSFTIQTWAPTEDRAEEMGEQIRMALLTQRLPYGFHSVSIDAGPYRHYDEDTRCPRYQLAIDAVAQLTR